MSQRPYQDCLNTAIRLLTRRDHSCKELERKLKQRKFQIEHIQPTLDECRRLNYLNDEKFADLYVGELQRKGYGPRRIQQMLADKGVAWQLISKSLCINYPEKKELKTCRDVLKKKLKILGPGRSGKTPDERLHRFLSGRGFSPAIIRKAIADDLS